MNHDEFAKKSWYGRIFEPKIVKSYARIDEARKEKEMIYLYR